jgi:hypothetical protein
MTSGVHHTFMVNCPTSVFTIAQSTVARYMYRGWPPSQGWRTFLTNHVDGIAAIDLFVMPTFTFRVL